MIVNSACLFPLANTFTPTAKGCPLQMMVLIYFSSFILDYKKGIKKILPPVKNTYHAVIWWNGNEDEATRLFGLFLVRTEMRMKLSDQIASFYDLNLLVG